MKDPELIPGHQYPKSMLIALPYAASSSFRLYKELLFKVPDAIIPSLYPCPLHVALSCWMSMLNRDLLLLNSSELKQKYLDINN